jgi:hypothetical protein
MFLQVCPVCEHRNPRGSRFCNECGSPLQLRFCPACGAAEDVMSLECRACGEKLPLVAVTDTRAAPEVDPIALSENIWKGSPPDVAELVPADDDSQVVVHGGAAPAPVDEAFAAPAPVAPEPASQFAAEPPSIAPAPIRTSGRTLIERLQNAQIDLAQHTREPPGPEAAPKPAVGRDPSSVEAENEIRICEAATPMDAGAAEVWAEAPAEAEPAATVHIDDIASQLRDGAWRGAAGMETSPGGALAPVVRLPQPVARRLSMHRVALAVAAVGAIAATAYAVRIAPGTSQSAATPAATPAVPAAASAPPPRIVERPAVEPAAGLAAAAALPADNPSSAAATTAVAGSTEQKVPEHPSQVAAAPPEPSPPAAAQPAAQAPAARRAAPAPPPASAIAPAPALARRAPAHTPRLTDPERPCTPAIAALALCTLEPGQEGNR